MPKSAIMKDIHLLWNVTCTSRR